MKPWYASIDFICNFNTRVGSDSYVTFADENDEDIGKGLVGDGLLLVDRKGGRKLAKLLKEWRPMNLIWLGFLPVFVW